MSDTQTKRRLAWAYLSRVFEGPNAGLQKLLNDGKGPEQIVQGIKKNEDWLGEVLSQASPRPGWERAEEDLALIAEVGGRLVTPDDPEWPRFELDQAFGFAASGSSEHLRSYQADAVAPHCLWVRGAPLSQLCAQAVTIVGTRVMSNYGAAVSTALVEDLIAHQWTIISGGAIGVDTVAHTTALWSNGCTIAVAACGLERCYPAQNAGLFEKIVSSGNGTMVSEYPPGSPPHRHRFLT